MYVPFLKQTKFNNFRYFELLYMCFVTLQSPEGDILSPVMRPTRHDLDIGLRRKTPKIYILELCNIYTH